MRRSLFNILLNNIYRLNIPSLVITPTVGSELVANGDFSAWAGDNPNSWTVSTEDANRYVTQNGTSAQIVSSGGAISIAQWSKFTTGSWYRTSVNIISGSAIALVLEGISWSSITTTGIKELSGKANYTYLRLGTTSASDVIFDDISAKQLTLSSLFTTYQTPVSDVTASVAITLGNAIYQQGLVLNLDSNTSPANFVIAYIDGDRCKLDKCVGGTYTNLINAAITYSAGATLQVVKAGAVYTVMYNGLAVGTPQTVTDAGIIGNKRHGCFSTDEGATFTNLSLIK